MERGGSSARDDDFLDYQEQEALDDLFRHHTQEFKKDLAYNALLRTKESVTLVRRVLAEAEIPQRHLNMSL